MSDGKSEGADGKALPEIVGVRPENYAGDVTPSEAWRVLEANPQAVLVDVRTRAEWSFVGLPDLSGLGKEPVMMEWQQFPTMAVNAGCASDLSSALGAARRNAPVLCLSLSRNPS